MDLQRASAGSGKTYLLAKIFIRDFLCYVKEVPASQATDSEQPVDGKVRRYILRRPPEVLQALKHILAITFTNKATNEMKQRIIEKLADLARGHRLATDPSGGFKRPEYLDFFLTECFTASGGKPTEDEVMETAEAALAELLGNYSDFNVSTIDSFFQLVLRTFAYELNLNDNFHLELDDDFIAAVGVGESLMSVNRPSDPNSAAATAWVRNFIAEKQGDAERWDIFRRDTSANSKSLYAGLLSFFSGISSEGFKQKLDDIKTYFESVDEKYGPGSVRFMRYYKEVRELYVARIKSHAEASRKALANLDALLTQYTAVGQGFAKGFSTALSYVRASRGITPAKAITQKGCLALVSDPEGAPLYTKKYAKFDEEFPQVRRLMAEALSEYVAWCDSFRIYKVVTGRLYFVGLMGVVISTINNFRQESNLLPLSDTNNILRRIIADEETPFIFERLGTQLHNFLIDEFQDTSRMQWLNMRPLLTNAESAGFDNLIIGDAKQSIYRFRNAEPELITYEVERDFPDTNRYCKITPNTNWRSARDIVEFNNALFKHLSARLDAEIDEAVAGGLTPAEWRRHPGDIYADVEQQIHHSDERGYVKIDFGSSADFLHDLPSLLMRLLKRGWHQSSIAILCNMKKECEAVIGRLLSFNKNERAALGDATPLFEIVSEEALRVLDSRSVKIILAILTILSDGELGSGETEMSEAEADEAPGATAPAAEASEQVEASERVRVAPIPSAKLELLYSLLLSGDPDRELTDVARQELETIVPRERIKDMLERMPVVTLPALVDAIAGEFLTEDMRAADAAYIAALQDAVIDYCDNYPSDVSAFLNWWNVSGKNVTIASPKGEDAITVMTIHKSKGLEFGVVVVPNCSWDLDISRRDKTMLWVKPEADGISAPELLPPWVPIGVGGADELMGTAYARDYIEEFDRSRIDELNKAYVAFTRAERELYINAPVPKDVLEGKKSDDKISTYLLNVLRSELMPECRESDEKVMTFGSLPDDLDLRAEVEETPESADEYISGYYVNAPMPSLHCCVDDSCTNLADPQEVVESVLRRRGRVVKSLLREMNEAADLERVLLRRLVDGSISSADMDRYREFVVKLLAMEPVGSWFAEARRARRRVSVADGRGDIYTHDRVVDFGTEVAAIDYISTDTRQGDRLRSELIRFMRMLSRHYESLGERKAITGYLLYIPEDWQHERPRVETVCL